MVEYLFLSLAAVGGTIMVCQFVMTLVGFGGHGADVSGGGHDLHFDAHPGGDAGAHADAHAESHVGSESDDHAVEHSAVANWVFSVITFRTLVAAATFFGLGGLAAQSAQLGLPLSFAIALACGAAALYGVAYFMRALHRFNADGTIRIGQAVGKTGTVYIPIPAGKAAAGKVQLSVQNRLMEYEAVTEGGEKLPTGARVVVTAVLKSNLLVVEPLPESVATAAH